MIELSFDQIAAAVGGRFDAAGTSSHPGQLCSGAVETDSREIAPGGIFVAKRGDATDGHLFAQAAADRGAALLIVERTVPVTVPQIVVPDAVLALGQLATEVVSRVRALGRLRIVAVTGSNGKTTTKNLLASILARSGNVIAARESFNNEVGAPLTMLRVNPTTDYLVAEMGASRRGEISRLVAMARPDVGIVLLVGLAHAGEFGGIEATVRAKSEMVTDLLPDATAVLNADDARVAGMAALTVARVLWFGRGEDADVRASAVRVGNTGTSFLLHLPREAPLPVRFRVLGEHHVSNALAAAAAASVLGVAPTAIVSGLESVTRAERWRMELMGGNGVTVINDAYNASPDSMAAALKTLAGFSDTRTVAVLGEMSELGEFADEEHDRIGRLAVRLNIAQLVVVGAGARRIQLAAAHEGSWDGEAVYFDSPDAAYDYLEGFCRAGDTILVKSSNSANLRFLGDRLGGLFACRPC